MAPPKKQVNAQKQSSLFSFFGKPTTKKTEEPAIVNKKDTTTTESLAVTEVDLKPIDMEIDQSSDEEVIAPTSVGIYVPLKKKQVIYIFYLFNNRVDVKRELLIKNQIANQNNLHLQRILLLRPKKES